jgi:hypothetical protein
MLDTLTLTLNNTSARQQITVFDASAREEVIIFGADEASSFSWLPLSPVAVSPLRASRAVHSEAYDTMLASEQVLRRDWEDPEEDAIWADL